jgi:hypothetical protein
MQPLGRALVAVAALSTMTLVGCGDGARSARIQSCVEATKFGAFVGEPDDLALWVAVGEDDAALRAACTDIAAAEPERLARISTEWDATQRALRAARAAAPTTTTDSSCDPSYPAMCIRNDAEDLDCSNIGATSFVVEPPDRHGLDTDHDGFGCVPGSDTG